MTHLLAWAAIAVAVAASMPGVSQAQGVAANTAKQVHLRAGPARDYPIVAILPAGFPITVEGCLQQYTWCDVIAGGSRGWVYAGNINYYYQGQWVAVPNYAPLIGIGVLGFILDDYWSHHYYDRPWYAQRHRWANHAPPAPPPRYRPQVPHGGVMPPPPGARPPPRSLVAPAVPLQRRPPGPVAPGTPLPGVRPAPQPHAPRPAAMGPAQQQRQLRQEQRTEQRHQRQERSAERDARRDNR